jgi:hypothetical protein
MPLRHALREAVALGAKFRMSGAAVSIEGITALPQRLCEALRAHQHYLWDLIDNGTDREPIELLDNLGVEPVLAETRYQARQAVRQIITDLAEHGPPIGLDIETSPRPEYAQPRPCAKFNANGCISDAQPPRKAYQDPAGTDPHRSDIALAQLYAGASNASYSAATRYGCCCCHTGCGDNPWSRTISASSSVSSRSAATRDLSVAAEYAAGSTAPNKQPVSSSVSVMVGKTAASQTQHSRCSASPFRKSIS